MPKTTKDPLAAGQAHRKHLKRSALGPWEPSLRQRDPIAILRAADAGRVPALAHIKQERMAASPFGFFRGAAPLMAYDLSLQPHTTLTTQLCGDAHIENLGAYTGLDNHLVFDINDFDESMRGPFEFDVKRMATSIVLAGQDIRIRNRALHLATRNFLRQYIGLIRTFSTMPVLDVARFQVHQLRAQTPIAKILRKAERSTPCHSQQKLTEIHHGKRVFRTISDLLRPATPAETQAALSALKTYRSSLLPERRHILDQFTPIAVGFKVVGTGSVGLRDYCVYLEGNGPEDPLFLQIKEEVKSAYAPYLSTASSPTHNGQRVAEGQRAMQLQTDPLLGWTHFGNRDYLVRQLNDHKAALDITTLNEAGLVAYAGVCGELLARGHARSADARLLAGYLGNGKRFTEAILHYATTYAVQTIADWKIFREKHQA